jgi:hypothetical protein
MGMFGCCQFRSLASGLAKAACASQFLLPRFTHGLLSFLTKWAGMGSRWVFDSLPHLHSTLRHWRDSNPHLLSLTIGHRPAPIFCCGGHVRMNWGFNLAR